MQRHAHRREEGIALLLVLIALVLVAALATEVSQTAATQGRIGRNTMNDFLLRSAIEGRANICRAALKYDATNGESIDTESDDWSWKNKDTLSSWGERASDASSSSQGPDSSAYANTNVQIVAWIEDERAKVNLLGLSRPRETADFKNTYELLIRVIDEFREPWSSLDQSEADASEMVDDLTDWLEEQSDDDENPMPSVLSGRGRLQSINDLLRVPGGKWKKALLFDVLDPDADPESGTDYSSEGGTDAEWSRANGIPGLANYLTVHAESQANAPLRININTCSKVVLRALFDARDADLADDIIENRREGAEDPGDSTAPADSAGGAAGGGGAGADDESGYFKNKGQLTRVDGMANALDEYPRLNFFADTRSDVFSIRIVATMVTGTTEGSFGDDPDQQTGPRDITASYQYREVVQRTDQGFVTLFVERRHDPIYQQNNQ